MTEDHEYGDEPPAEEAPAAREEYAADLPETGDPQVDEVLSPLAGLPGQPVAEHVAGFEQVHRGLQEALAQVEDAESGD